jgi:oxygen-independent coproporphyrinogen-3 oxidase
VGLGPSAVSTRGFERWQNVADHREYARRLFANESPVASLEKLTPEMKRTERIALGLRAREGITADIISIDRIHALSRAGLLRHNTNRIVLTTAGKLLADSVAEELV